MTTPDQATKILDALFEQLRKRQHDIDTFSNAYNGEFRLHYASKDFREFYAARYQSFSDNWCGIVADAPHERLEPVGIRLPGEAEGDGKLWVDWLENDADAFCDLAMLDAIISKRAFGLVWGDGDGDPRVTFEHPSQAIVGYDPETHERVAGAKIWYDDDSEYATLYLPAEVWKFERARTTVTNGQTESGLYVTGVVDPSGGWKRRMSPGDQSWPLPNPLGKVPLVELPNRPRLMGEPISDIAGTLSMQHAINLIWSQLFLGVDNASWPQKVIMGAEMPTIPVLNEAGESIGEQPIDLKKFAMDRAIWLEDPAAKIGEWSSVNLEAYTRIIDIAVGHIAAQTRTPAHYLLLGGTIANISSDAMKALETGLVKRTEEKTQHFGRGIRDIFELIALVRGDVTKAANVKRGTVLWKDVENRSDAQTADAALKDKAIGLPLEFILERRYNLPPPEIKRVLAMIASQPATVTPAVPPDAAPAA